MKKILMIALVGLLAVACTKPQSAVKALDGQWNVTSMTVSEHGKTMDLVTLGLEGEYTFNKCKLKDEEFCDMTVKTTFGGDSSTESAVFKVTDNGTKLVMAESDTSSAEDQTTINIVELSRKNAKFTQTEDGGTTEIVLEKK